MNEREKFRQIVFDRDKKCVVPDCKNPIADAHHIIERSLWVEKDELGGYLPDNGASLCAIHHVHAEKNFFPPQALRQWAGITHRILPKQLDEKLIYDKWGKVLPSSTRIVLKYPHTRYLPFSPGADERDLRDCGYIEPEVLLEKPLVITIKMDGSNVKMTNKIVTARNGHNADHKSFDFLKKRYAEEIQHLIPDDIGIFAEWLYAKHSIHYDDKNPLNDTLQIFGVYNERTQLWYGWKDVENLAKSIGVITVPVLGYITYTTTWDLINNITRVGNSITKTGHEGLVIRTIYPFHWSQFGDNLGKFVRQNHVTTSVHWSNESIVKNEVRT